MSISIEIGIQDAGVNARLEQLFAGLTDRTELHEAIGRDTLNLTRDYLTEIAQYRHKSAEAIGGTPTGFLSRAAEQTGMSASPEAATVTIRSPGIGRVDHDVTITPTEGRQWLTLPIAGIAYGRTVSQVQDMLGKRFFRPGSKANPKNVLALGDGKGGLKLYFALVKSVFQKQDRSLLPSDQAYKDAALKGVRSWLDYVLFWKEAA